MIQGEDAQPEDLPIGLRPADQKGQGYWGLIPMSHHQTIFVILSAAQNLFFVTPPRFFTELSSVQHDIMINSFLTATQY